MNPGGGILSVIVMGQRLHQWIQTLGSSFQHGRTQTLMSMTLKTNPSPNSKSTSALVWDFFIHWKYKKCICTEYDTLSVVAIAVGMK